jgi:hypothetical protein
MTAVPVRTVSGPLHLCKATGRGYRTACGRTLTGARLVVPPRRLWRKAWDLELVCQRCDRRREQARTDSELARLAGW